MRLLTIKAVIIIVFFVLLGSCKLNKENGDTNGAEVPVPTITSVLPTAIFSSSPSFTLYINGRDFVEGAVVFINQKLRKPTAVSNETITCVVGPEDWDGSLDVAVGNPTTEGFQKFSNQVAVPILTEGNITFSTPLQVAALTAQYSVYQDMETDNNGNIYVVYPNFVNDVGEVFLVRSADYGETWESPVNVSDTGRHSDLPDVAAGAGGNLYVCWWEGDDANAEDSAIYLIRSTDNGATWSSPSWVLRDYTHCRDPRIYVDAGGTINLVFTNKEGEFEVPYCYFARSTDNGETWNAVRIGEGDDMVQYPLTEDGNGVLHTAYLSYNSALYGDDLLYARSTDHGMHWISRTISHEISSFRGHVFPALAFSGSTIYAAWNYDLTHRAGSRQVIYFARSLDAGETWEPEIEMDELVYNCSGDKADMVLDSRGNIYMLMSLIHVFMARSTDGGQTWTPPMFIYKSEVHSHPCMAIDTMDNLFIAWSDNGNIYFCKNKTPLGTL
jgi:hypothetical protein